MMQPGQHFGRALSAFFLLSSFAAAAQNGVDVHTLSGRPDMVTGESALVEASSGGEKITASINGRDISTSFKPGNHGSLVGLVEGLNPGKNTLEVRTGRGSAKLELVDHPITGPVFSGPHQKPFVCQTEQAGLGVSLDGDCSVRTVVSYAYKSTDPPPAGGRARGGAAPVPGALPAGFKAYNPNGAKPADIAKVTTSDGKTIDYIVRRERGTINRAIYEIAILEDPSQGAPDPWTPSAAWNGRLIYSFGGGCAAGYRQGLPGSAINDEFLRRGFAVAASSLNVFGNTCDDVISSETMMMVKEHFIKEFGVPVHTIGTGGSGGAIQQLMMAQNYPGLLDGLMPQIAFPDNAIFEDVIDCTLLSHAFGTTKQPWNDDQKALISGFATFKTCSTGWETGLAANQVDATACAPIIPKTLVFDPVANRKGARCDYFDNEVNVYGTDPRTGTARRPLDNVGVQYGLTAFNAGQISAEQFVELNEVIGGHDVDGKLAPARDVADPAALKIAYQSGRVNTGGGSLNTVPILDWRAYLDMSGNLHDRFRSMVIRARLTEANGTAGNQVTLLFPPSGPAPLKLGDLAAQMNQWLDNIAADASHDSPLVKVARDKPSGLTDACWTTEGEKIVEPLSWKGKGRCNDLYPAHADSRIVSGAPLTDEVLKCQVRPFNASDYSHPLTAEQASRLKTVFSSGVCDYTKPGVSQQKVEGTWHRY
ncbi:MAG TPA: DUF6351 family protein [Bryobacteraceae bacterium]|jgi:hypothetical protein|nr:DUF6351 family protein [Bryobacteraceae bacterium]